MREQLFSVGIRNKKTGEETDLLVWATDVTEATNKLSGVVLGYSTEYDWTGSGPVHENNEIVTRMVNDGPEI